MPPNIAPFCECHTVDTRSEAAQTARLFTTKAKDYIFFLIKKNQSWQKKSSTITMLFWFFFKK